MISGNDVYKVVSALVPLYVAMFLAYGSVRWWGVFTPVQCSGINRFVAMFAVPFLGFRFIGTSNLFAINYRFIAADTLQKLVILVALAIWPVLLSAKAVGVGVRVGPEWAITLFSLSSLPNTLIIGIPILQAMYGDSAADLMVQIIVFQSVIWYNVLLLMFEYRAAKALINERFPGATHEIASIKVDSDVVSLSGIEPLETDAERDSDGRLRVRVRRSSIASSSFNDSFRLSSIRSGTPRASNLSGVEIYSIQSSPASSIPSFSYTGREVAGVVPMVNGSVRVSCDFRSGGGSSDFDLPPEALFGSKGRGKNHLIEEPSDHGGGGTGGSRKVVDEGGERSPSEHEAPPATVMAKLILLMVWRKLIRNPNTYASLLGVIWSLVSNRYHVQMPPIVKGSITIISNTGLGMAVFSLGLFTALQPRIIACRKTVAGMSMAVKFLLGPAVMAATSLAIGIRGELLHVAIVQAALPLGLVPFVFAKEYDLHADVISTSVIFGMLMALPVTIVYHALLEL